MKITITNLEKEMLSLANIRLQELNKPFFNKKRLLKTIALRNKRKGFDILNTSIKELSEALSLWKELLNKKIDDSRGKSKSESNLTDYIKLSKELNCSIVLIRIPNSFNFENGLFILNLKSFSCINKKQEIPIRVEIPEKIFNVARYAGKMVACFGDLDLKSYTFEVESDTLTKRKNEDSSYIKSQLDNELRTFNFAIPCLKNAFRVDFFSENEPDEIKLFHSDFFDMDSGLDSSSGLISLKKNLSTNDNHKNTYNHKKRLSGMIEFSYHSENILKKNNFGDQDILIEHISQRITLSGYEHEQQLQTKKSKVKDIKMLSMEEVLLLKDNPPKHFFD